jgi:DNA-binding IclR family transcriptional regulator
MKANLSETKQDPSMTNEKVEGSGRRLLLLLEVISGLDGDFSLKDLTSRSNLPTTTVHRLLQILLETNMVERSGGQSYRPGVRLLRLASTLLKDLDPHDAAQPFLHELWRDWQETAVFAVYRPQTRTAMVANAIAAPHPLRYVIERYTEISLAWGSFGRAILAHLPPREAKAVIAARSKSPLTGRQPPGEEELVGELARIRENGVAIYVDLSIDVAGVAAPVFGAQRSVIGCIGLAMPGSRFGDHDQARIREAVIGAANRLSEAIGWAPLEAED